MRGSSHHHEYSVLDRGAACLQCKKRKKRCDGVKPVCGPCIRIGTADQCEFPQPPPPKVKKPKTPPRSKNETLRAQIRLLEDKIGRLQAAISTSSHSSTLGTYLDESSSPSCPGSSVGPLGHDEELLMDDDQTRQVGSISKISQIPDVPSIASSFSTSPPPLPPSAGSPLSQRLLQGDVPLPSWSEEMFDVFMRYRHRCGYEIDEERFSRAFLASLRANRRRHGHGMSHVPDMSEGDSDRSDDRWAKYEDDMATDSAPTREHGGEKLIHPALMNAVLLLGCHFATLNGSPSAMTARGASRLPSLPQQRSSRSSETPQGSNSPTPRDLSRLLQFTRLALESSLNCADRLHDFLLATSLLVYYYFATGRISEAQYHSAGLAGFVGACKLNELDVSDRTVGNREARMLIDAPRDRVEVEERACLFWNVFVLNKYAALVYGTMSALRDDLIWTPWPRPPEEWGIPRRPEYNVSSAWISTMPALNHFLPTKTELTFRSVSIFLLEGVMRLQETSSISRRPSGESRTEADLVGLTRDYENLRDTAQRITEWLPSLELSSNLRDSTVTAVAPHVPLASRHYHHHQTPSSSSSSYSEVTGQSSGMVIDTNILDLQNLHIPSPSSSGSAIYTYSASGSSPLSSTYAYFPSSSASSPALSTPIMFGGGVAPSALRTATSPPPLHKSMSVQHLRGRSVGHGHTQLRTEYSQGSVSPPQLSGQSGPSPASSSYSLSHPMAQTQVAGTPLDTQRKPRRTAALLFAHCVVKAASIHLGSISQVLFGIVTETDGSPRGPRSPHEYSHQQAGQPQVSQQNAPAMTSLGQQGHPQGLFQQHVGGETSGLDQSGFHTQSHHSQTRGLHQQYHDLAGGTGAGTAIPDYNFVSSGHGGQSGISHTSYPAPMSTSTQFLPSPPSSSGQSQHSYSSHSPISNPNHSLTAASSSTFYAPHSSSPLNPNASNAPLHAHSSTLYSVPQQTSVSSFYSSHPHAPPTPDTTAVHLTSSPSHWSSPAVEGSATNVGDEHWARYIQSSSLPSGTDDGGNAFAPLRKTPLSLDPQPTLKAAKEISEMAGVVLAQPDVFDELDMMIGLPWVTACQVLGKEMQALTENSVGSTPSFLQSHMPSPQTYGQHSSSFIQDTSHSSASFQPPQVELLHHQQYQAPYASAQSRISLHNDQNSGSPISPDSFSYTQHPYASLEPIAFPGLKTSGPMYSQPGGEKVNVTVNELKEQRDVLLRALDRLGNMYEIVRMMRSTL